MGHHIDKEGRFQSDKYPDLPPDKILVSFQDLRARAALVVLAQSYALEDSELSEDILYRLNSIYDE